MEDICRIRIDTLKASYKACKKKENKSGTRASTWEYFDIMDRILGQNPIIKGISRAIDASKMEAEQSKDQDLNEPLV